jgi:hypothetical protein
MKKPFAPLREPLFLFITQRRKDAEERQGASGDSSVSPCEQTSRVPRRRLLVLLADVFTLGSGEGGLCFGIGPAARRQPYGRCFEGGLLLPQEAYRQGGGFGVGWQLRWEWAGPDEVAIVACMRKLLTIVNTLIKMDLLWSNETASQETPETLRRH